MERCLEKVPEDKWEMERSPLIGQKSAASSVLVLHMYTVFICSGWKYIYSSTYDT